MNDSARSSGITPADQVSWKRLLILVDSASLLVQQPNGIQWNIKGFEHLAEQMPPDGMTIIDIRNYTSKQLYNINHDGLRKRIGHRVGKIVLHGYFSDNEAPATVNFTVEINNKLSSVIHVLTVNFFAHESFRSHPHRTPDGWNAATKLLAGFTTDLFTDTADIDQILSGGVQCHFDEVIWAMNQANGPFDSKFKLKLRSYRAVNVREEDPNT